MGSGRAVRWACRLALVAALPAQAGTLRGDGLSFPAPLPGLGEALELVGRLDPAVSSPPFPMNLALEYTWSVYGPVVHTIDDATPGLSTRDLTFGILEIRGDAALNSSFSPFPPNAVVPSTFHDGSVVLLGPLIDLRILDVFGIVTAAGTVQFDSGDALGSLGQLRTWTFRAAISTFGPGIPPGFGSNWSLELDPVAPVGVEGASWGAIKALYR